MLIKLVLQFCRKQYSMTMWFMSSYCFPKRYNKEDKERNPFLLVISHHQSLFFFCKIHCLCKTNLAWLSLRHFVRLLTEGHKKVPRRERYFTHLKKNFTRPCCQAPKAYIGMFVTIARKVLTAKIQYFSFGLTNRIYFTIQKVFWI